MKKRSILAELLLIFFLLGEICIFANAKASFGNNTLFTTRVMPVYRSSATRLVKATGAEYGREEFNWEKINPKKGSYRWADPDHAISIYKANNIKVLGLIAYSAPWASTNPGAGSDAQFYKPNMDEWRNYVGQLVRRYGYYVKDWEIWNEPNYSGFWRDAGIGEYRELLVAAYDTIKSIDPGAKVITGGLTYADEGWISELMDNGGWEHSDAIGVHYYADTGPDFNSENNLRRRLVDLENRVLGPRGGKEIWVTEMGWESAFVGDANQGWLLSRGLAMAKSVGMMQKVFTYSLKNEPDGKTYGMLTTGYGLKPAYHYVKKTVETIGARSISQTIEMDGSNFYIWNGPGGPTAMAWNGDRTETRGFHINASGLSCYNYQGNDVSSRAIKGWDNGNVSL